MHKVRVVDISCDDVRTEFICFKSFAQCQYKEANDRRKKVNLSATSMSLSHLTTRINRRRPGEVFFFIYISNIRN